jgi:hypothetical protein
VAHASRPDGIRLPFAVVLVASWSMSSIALAQAPGDPAEPFTEEPDPTRLDVERLPPEAIEITRDLYAHGFFVEGWAGGRGFVTGLGSFSHLGFYGNVGFGLEIFDWLLVRVALEASFHETSAPAPPSPTAFEILGAVAEGRFHFNFTPFVALWLQGEFAVVKAFGDVLRIYGFDQAENVGIAFGGTLGFDWHMKNRHSSIGLAGGARLYPSFATFAGEQTIGVHASAYIRYVF